MSHAETLRRETTSAERPGHLWIGPALVLIALLNFVAWVIVFVRTPLPGGVDHHAGALSRGRGAPVASRGHRSVRRI